MDKFEERENKRRKSVVGAIISNGPELESSAAAEETTPSITGVNILPKIKTEKRTSRLNLLVGPTARAKAQEKCDKMGISLNECINQFLIDWGNS